jgi:hypothetical protein
MMTDIPAFAALTVSLALGRRALERRSWWLWTLWVIVSFWGFTVRRQTIVAPLGILVLALWPHEWRTRAAWQSWLTRRTGAIIAFGAVLLLADLVIDRWRKGLAGGGSPSGQIHWPGTEHMITMGPGIVLMLGLFLRPLIVLLARPSRWSWPARITSLAVLGLLLIATCSPSSCRWPLCCCKSPSPSSLAPAPVPVSVPDSRAQPGWTLTETPTYRTYRFFGSTGHLYVYRTAEKTCQ